MFYSSAERVPVGAHVLVYDLGGGTFDAAILRKHETGFELAGPPEGLERVGGIDIDEAVLEHVWHSLLSSGQRLDAVDLEDPMVTTLHARLREDCVAAKEALSADTASTIAVGLPGIQTQVRLVRAELEAMIDPVIAETLPGRTRVVASNVADRLGQLVAAAVAHQRAVGRPSELDLDRLVERATADVARRRPRPEVSG